MNLLQILKESINTIYVNYIGNDEIEKMPIYYIGGSQTLPPPLSQEEEETVLNYDKGLKKTREEFISELSNLSKKYKFINEDYFEELENIVLMAGIGVSTVMHFVDLL